MLFCFVSLAESSHLGRPDYASLPQQTLMELFMENVTNREKICGSKEEPTDISKWKGVTINADGDVTSLSVLGYGLRGSLAFEWLPTTVSKVVFTTNSLAGTLDLDRLNESITFLAFTGNKLSGTLSLTQLPSRLSTLFLNSNRFTGSVDLTQLPQQLKSFSLGSNRLTGSINVTKLPITLEFMNLSYNDFEGETDFSQLPKALRNFHLQKNPRLSGKIRNVVGLTMMCNETEITILPVGSIGTVE